MIGRRATNRNIHICASWNGQIVMSNRTFTMIKPGCNEKNGHAGKVSWIILLKLASVLWHSNARLSAEKAGRLYAVYKERPLRYGELVEFMSSGVTHCSNIGKDNAVADFVKWLVLPIPPRLMKVLSVAPLYATSVGETLSRSDSDETQPSKAAFLQWPETVLTKAFFIYKMPQAYAISILT